MLFELHNFKALKFFIDNRISYTRLTKEIFPYFGLLSRLIIFYRNSKKKKKTSKLNKISFKVLNLKLNGRKKQKIISSLFFRTQSPSKRKPYCI